MHRKPLPKEAAALVRGYLADQGIELSQPKALEIIARVEGYADWRTMWAAIREEVAQREKNKRPEPTLYERFWEGLLPVLSHKMSGLCFVMRGNVRDDYRVLDPGEFHDDESSMSFLVQHKGRMNDVPVLVAKTRLVENELRAGEFALRLSIEDYQGEELLSWTSGQNYSPDLFCSDIEELRERLTNDLQPGDILLALYEDRKAARLYLKPRP